MLYANIWESVQFIKLSPHARLLYIGTITHADDDGRLRASSVLLKSKVFPEDANVTQNHVRKWINDVVKSGLVTYYKHEGEYYIQHPNWVRYQTIRGDMYEQSNIPPPEGYKEKLRNNSVTKPLRKRYIREVKLSKDKTREYSSVDWLRKIPDDVLDEWVKRFDCSRDGIKSKAEDLALWCETNGKMKRNYKTFLLVALKKDFPERKAPPPKAKQEPEEEIDRESVKAQLRKTRETLGFQKPMGVGEEKIANVGQ